MGMGGGVSLFPPATVPDDRQVPLRGRMADLDSRRASTFNRAPQVRATWRRGRSRPRRLSCRYDRDNGNAFQSHLACHGERNPCETGPWHNLRCRRPIKCLSASRMSGWCMRQHPPAVMERSRARRARRRDAS